MKVLSPTSIAPTFFTEFEKNRQRFLDYNSEYSQWFEQCFQDKTFSEQLDRVWFSSQYVFDLCCRRPAIFQQLVDHKLLTTSYTETTMANHLAMALNAVDSVECFDSLLRINRSKEMLRIIWRDLNRLANLQETTRDVSSLAEASIQQALAYHQKDLAAIYGVPTADVDGIESTQNMLVIAMGKLGAWELNLSSDIDLIFCYPHRGETVGAKRTLDNGEFFTRVARKLIQSLDQMTSDGFVFRVDMRLRPYGESGALVLSFGAMEEYYQDQGRDWERYAMVKARVVAGEKKSSIQLMELLRPFTYRRYLDFSAFDALRSMKKMIQQEVKRRRLDNDIKLGPGGIREVEFIAQCFQLIRGGRERGLQERRVQKVLTLLADKQFMPTEAIDQLQKAYIFLRNAEHAIQAFNDQQTQDLPIDDLPKTALAFVMGFSTWNSFFDALSQHRSNVSRHFKNIIADDTQESNGDDNDSVWSDVCLGNCDEDQARHVLEQAGHENSQDVLLRLARLRDSAAVQRMQTVGHERLNQFLPLLLQAVANTEQPSSTLLRIFPLVESVIRRTAYLVLLVENPGGLKQLVILCAASPWIADKLAKQPVLLDELLDARTLYQVPDKAALRDDLKQQMLRVPWDDLEAHMEGLRYFKQAHQLHLSAAEVTHKLPLMQVSDYLTMIAEVVLEHVLELAWFNLTAKHGFPQKAKGIACNKDFIIVAYGKMGGIELGHNSDLDLVFIHDAASNMATDGARPIDNAMFFARLGQRIIHILTTQTPLGDLYEVDMRLRPSGASGLLVSTINAFEEYQRKDAWTWEHQALVRARVVAGDTDLGQRFEALRQKLLCVPREPVKLKADVVAMRQKMRDHLGSKPADRINEFHLKQDAGGIVDIEFLTQYAVLKNAADYSALAHWSDNIRILESLQCCGVMSQEEAEGLTEAYKVLRSATHRLALQQDKNIVGAQAFIPERILVKALWNRWFEGGEASVNG
jgi:glutamate-ammonia-ligase adenylyltransferase